MNRKKILNGGINFSFITYLIHKNIKKQNVNFLFNEIIQSITITIKIFNQVI